MHRLWCSLAHHGPNPTDAVSWHVPAAPSRAAVARPGVPDCRSHWVGRHHSAPQIPAPGWAEPGPDVPADLPVFTRGVVSCPLLRASTGVSPSEQHILPRPPSLPRSCWEQVGFGSPWGRHPSSGSSFEPLTELRIPPCAFEATEEVGALWCQGCRAAPVSVSPVHPGRAVAGGDRHSWKHPLPTGAGVGSIHRGHMQDVAGSCHSVLLTV